MWYEHYSITTISYYHLHNNHNFTIIIYHDNRTTVPNLMIQLYRGRTCMPVISIIYQWWLTKYLKSVTQILVRYCKTLEGKLHETANARLNIHTSLSNVTIAKDTRSEMGPLISYTQVSEDVCCFLCHLFINQSRWRICPGDWVCDHDSSLFDITVASYYLVCSLVSHLFISPCYLSHCLPSVFSFLC